MEQPTSSDSGFAIANAISPKVTLKLKFTGSANEYFRIWIINLCLTLLTLGIFSAWAKVRKKRYFYSQTRLAGTPFQYLGQPIPILKGRIIAAVLFLTYFVANHFLKSTLPYVLVFGAFVAPWMLIRSAAFNARNSAYRNITFDFKSSWVEAARVVHWIGIVPLYILGTILPLWNDPKVAGVAFLIAALFFPYWLWRFKSFLISNLSYGGRRGEFGTDGNYFFAAYFVGSFIVVAAAAGTMAIRSITSMHHDVIPRSAEWALTYGLIYTAYAVAYAYIQTRITNLVWNNTKLGPLRFQSDLQFKEMLKLYLTNAAAILLSCGLLIPWAVVRSLRYRTEKLFAISDADLTEFHGHKGTMVNAIGAETMDLFDLDIAL